MRQKLKKVLRRERRKINPSLQKMVDLKHTIALSTLKITQETAAYMKQTIENKILNLKPGNQFFREVNSITGRKNTQKIDHLVINNKKQYNPNRIKKEFTTFYHKLYQKQTPHHINRTPKTNRHITDFSV